MSCSVKIFRQFWNSLDSGQRVVIDSKMQVLSLDLLISKSRIIYSYCVWLFKLINIPSMNQSLFYCICFKCCFIRFTLLLFILSMTITIQKILCKFCSIFPRFVLTTNCYVSLTISSFVKQPINPSYLNISRGKCDLSNFRLNFNLFD